MSDLIQIEIPNWEKYNPKRDQKTYTWLRLDQGIGTDPNLFGLSAEQKFVWIMILCEASKNNTGTVLVNIGWISDTSKVRTGEIKSLISFLEEKQIIETPRPRTTAHDRASECPRPRTTPTNERTNERTEEESSGVDTPAQPLPKIAMLWNQLKHNAMPQVRACGSSRKKHAELRWKENPCENFWTEVITRIGDSDFCRGKNQRAWIADFDFLIRPETAHKVLEGKYDNPKTHSEVHPALRGN